VRESFFTYLQHRLTGFDGYAPRPQARDLADHPDYLAMFRRQFGVDRVNLGVLPVARGPVTYADRGALERECSTFREVLDGFDGAYTEAFMTAPSPGIVAAGMTNEHYPSIEAFVGDVARALRTEYTYIVEQGYLLQLDCPDFGFERHVRFGDEPLETFVEFVDTVITALNGALEGIPPERVRMHVCWGNIESPHDHDVELREILPSLYRARVGAVMLSMANPRHAHEYRLFRDEMPLPDGWSIIAGTIDTTTNYVEHPEAVADRIERVAGAVGDPTRVLAGTDCGFSTAAGMEACAPSVTWAKLRSLTVGARIASERVFGNRAW
jgi:5-methyltetrahydropteroyltriglutamate--homocysteine methyltransferase